MHSLLAPGITIALLLKVMPPEARPAPARPKAAIAARTEEIFYVGEDGQVITPDRVARFLRYHESPLLPHARRIVATAARYRVDPRWIVAIAGTETTFGRYHKGYNAWGWDAPNGLRRWSSWEEAIDEYTRYFSRGYRVRTPDRVGARYAPFAPDWPATTKLFFSRI